MSGVHTLYLKSTQGDPMVNLALTMLPIVVTFGVAAWMSPSSEVQPRSALRGGNPTSRPTPCDC